MVRAGCMRWSEMGWPYTENAKTEQPCVGLGPFRSPHFLRAAGPDSIPKSLTNPSKGVIQCDSHHFRPPSGPRTTPASQIKSSCAAGSNSKFCPALGLRDVVQYEMPKPPPPAEPRPKTQCQWHTDTHLLSNVARIPAVG